LNQAQGQRPYSATVDGLLVLWSNSYQPFLSPLILTIKSSSIFNLSPLNA